MIMNSVNWERVALVSGTALLSGSVFALAGIPVIAGILFLTPSVLVSGASLKKRFGRKNSDIRTL
jgi:hypothetical protein